MSQRIEEDTVIEERVTRIEPITPLPYERLHLDRETFVQGAPERVLVVEDEPSMVKLIETILSEEGFTVQGVRDGQQAIHALVTGWNPDLVLLDLMMPKVNGRQVIAYMKDDPCFRRIPILAMSAGINLKTLGFDDHRPDALLAKPFDIDTLVAQVMHLLHRNTS